MTIPFTLLFLSCSSNNIPDNTPLTTQGVHNLATFAKLYGYVRYFHPSTESRYVDWDKFLVLNTIKIEEAKDNSELQQTLEDLFLPIAPTLVINSIEKSGKKIPDENYPATKEVVWKHNNYSEEINIQNYIGENKPDTVFKNLTILEKIFRTDIGSGLSIEMPVVLKADSFGTFPRGDTNKIKQYSYKDDNFINSQRISRNIRFAGIIKIWNVIQHFYAYYDLMPVNWSDELPVALKNTANDSTDIEYLNTLKKFTALINDCHTSITYTKSDGNNFYPPFRADVIENKIAVTQIRDDIKDKLKYGDIILEINGNNADSILISYDSLVSGASLNWKRVDESMTDRSPSYRKGSLEMLLGGKDNSVIKLKLISPDGKERNVDFKRESSVFYNDIHKKKFEEIKPGLFYIDLTRISNEEYYEYRKILKTARGIIYDIRGFWDLGYLPVADMIDHDIIYPFTMYNLLTSLPDHKSVDYFPIKKNIIQCNNEKLIADKVVLTNYRAMSSAESMVLTIKHFKLATVIGEPTAGSDGVMNSFSIPGGFRIWFTGLKFLNPDGSRFHGIGVQPDILVKPTLEGIRQHRDEQLDKAIEILKK